MSNKPCRHGMFEQLFRGVAEPYAAFAPDAPTFTILAVNDAFEHVARRSRDELVGHGFFEIFSASFEGQDAAEIDRLRQSLTRVAREGGEDAVGAIRYDLPADTSNPEVMFERWWSPRSTAITNDGEIDLILYHVEDISEFVVGERGQETDLDDDRACSGDERVLIVEPDGMWRCYLEGLSGTRWKTCSAATPGEAIEIATEIEPQLILISQEACGTGDRCLLAELRADARLSSCRVISLVSQANALGREAVKQRGLDDVLFARASAHEILSRMQAQIALVKSRQMFEERSRRQIHELFMNAPAFIAVLEGPDHVYTLNNPAHDALLGHREIIGRSVKEVFGEGISHEALVNLDRVYETGEVFSIEEALMEFGDPERDELRERYLTLAYMPSHDLSGNIDGVAVFGWDVTEEVVARQTIEKQALQLQREARLKDEFLAMLGHELRNPLAPLATVAQIMQLQADTLSPERVKWAADIIDRQVSQLTGLVDDLLDVARIREGRIELERDHHGLDAIVQAAVDSVEPSIERRQQRLTLSVPSEEVILDVDKTRLTQVLSNLLHNATKYTPDHGELRLEAMIEGEEIVFAVEDTGEGIDAELLPHVFDLFRQSDNSLARTHGGLGLGLTLVRRLVEMHGGSVCATSEGPGKGSRFEVRLPVVCAPEEASSHAVSAQK